MRFSLFFLLIVAPLFSLKAEKVFTVNASMSLGDIQKTVDNANAGDIIRFSQGTYTFENSLIVDKSMTFEGTANTRAVKLQISSDNIRHITATNGKIKIRNLTFQVGSNINGGGIEYVGQDSLIVSNCDFYNNRNKDGGAIYSLGNSVIETSLFNANTAMVAGGAIYTKGKAFVSDCFFANNNAAQGGAVFNQSRSATRVDPLDIRQSTFSSNDANQGGAVWSDNPLEIQSCVFSDSQARSENGGALYTKATATVIGTIFYNNYSAKRGAGLFTERIATISECFFTKNIAGDFGGAICNDYSGNAADEEFTIVRSSVFTKNQSGRGGAIYSSFSLIAIDCSFEENVSYSSGGGLFCDKNLLLNRTCFEGNSASNEGGAVDALKVKAMNSTMTGNNSQNASAIHAHEDINVLFSTFSGNRATLKSGGVIYGNNVTAYANIVAGNFSQDKITGKIRGNEYNIVGENNIQNTFEYVQGNVPMLSKAPGFIPVIPIKVNGNAFGKIPSSQIQKWEKELGISDFLYQDQLKNPRMSARSTDIGAVIANAQFNSPQVPAIDLDRMLADINSKTLFVSFETPVAQTRETTRAVPPSPQTSTPQTYEQAQVPIQQAQTSERTNRAESQPAQSKGTNFDDDLDVILNSIYADDEQPEYYRPGQQQTLAENSPATQRGASAYVKSKQAASQPEKDISQEKLSAQLAFNAQPEQPSIYSERPERPAKEFHAAGIPENATSLSDNLALSGVYTINPAVPFGDRNFTSIEEAINLLNSRGNNQEVQFVIAPGIYLVHRPLTISNGSFPIIFTGREDLSNPVILRSSGNNRVIVIAVNTPVTMERMIFEGPEGATMGKNVRNGGGISCNTDALLTFEECIFRYNKNPMGGGIFARNVLVSRCSFHDNISSDGGGIYSSECMAINSTFYGNASAAGGGIYCKDKATAVFCTFTQNEANGKAAAIFSPNVNLYGCIATGNKSKSDFTGELNSNFSNILDNANPFNVFAEVDVKGNVKLDTETIIPVVLIKPGGMAAEQISESLLFQWEDELGLGGFLAVDQEGKRRPQNRNAEIGAWEIPFRRGN